MTETLHPRRIGRSAAAIVVGFLAVVVLSLGTDFAVYFAAGQSLYEKPMSEPQFALAVVYRSLYAVVGSFIAARMAPSRPMKHALILGGIGLLACAAGLAATWDKPDLGPRWYGIALVVTALPCAWIGGRFRCRGS